MNQAWAGLKRALKLKRQLGDQVIACGLNDEALGRACQLFAEASYQCLKLRDIKLNNAVNFIFSTKKVIPSKDGAEKLSDYQKRQNTHAAKSLWQWDVETAWAMERLDAAIDDSKNPRLSVRLLSARNNLAKQTEDRRRAIMASATQNRAKPLRPPTKGQRAQLDFIEKHDRLILVVQNGSTHMFSTQEAADAFQRSGKDYQTSLEMDRVYHSEGFISFAAFCESAVQNPALWDEFNLFVNEEAATRKRGKRATKPQPEQPA
jgi:hypothetical protein